MEFIINNNNPPWVTRPMFYLSIDDKDKESDFYLIGNEEISQYLDIPLKKYETILMNRNGILLNDTSISIYFKNKKDCENVIKDLEPYFIMAKLTE